MATKRGSKHGHVVRGEFKISLIRDGWGRTRKVTSLQCVQDEFLPMMLLCSPVYDLLNMNNV